MAKKMEPNCFLPGKITEKRSGKSNSGDMYVNFVLYDGFYYHKCVAWKDLAEKVDRLPEGSEVKIDGQIRYKSFTGTDGVKRTVTNIYTLGVEVINEVPEGDDDVMY